MDFKQIGSNLKTIRKFNNLTQAKLAENLHISTVHLAHIESGERGMSIELLLDICRLTNSSPDDILLGEYSVKSDDIKNLVNDSSDAISKEDLILLNNFIELLKERNRK